MIDYSDSIAIVFPADWPVTDPLNPLDIEPHVTLMYLGKISEVDFSREDVMAVLATQNIASPGGFKPSTLEYFGVNEDILVLTFDSSRLQGYQFELEKALNEVGIKNGSYFPTYRPHLTLAENISVPLEEVGDIVGEIPEYITLFSPVLWWGSER